MTSDVNLFAEIMKQPKPHEIVPFTRKLKLPDGAEKDINVAIIELTSTETVNCRVRAEKAALKDLAISEPSQSAKFDEIYEERLAHNVLYDAVRLENDLEKRFFPVPNSVAELAPTEIDILMKHYYSVALYKGKLICDMTQEEKESFYAKIQSGGKNPVFLANFLSSHMKDELLVSLIKQFPNLLQNKSLFMKHVGSGTSTNKKNKSRFNKNKSKSQKQTLNQ